MTKGKRKEKGIFVTGVDDEGLSAVLESFALEGLLDCILAEAAQSMLLEDCCGVAVLFVLVATNAAKLGLAEAGSAREEMEESTVVILDNNVVLEKRINRRAPCKLCSL